MFPLSTEENNWGDRGSRVRVFYQLRKWPRCLGMPASVSSVCRVSCNISGTVRYPNAQADWRAFNNSPRLVGETRAAMAGGSSCTLSGISQWCSAVENSEKYRQMKRADL